MDCPICNTEMKGGFSIHPGMGGFIRVVNLDEDKAEKLPLLNALICPKCGKTEFFVDIEKIEWQ